MMLLSVLFARVSSVESRWRVAGIAVLNSVTIGVFKVTFLFLVCGRCPGKLSSPTSSQLQPVRTGVCAQGCFECRPSSRESRATRYSSRRSSASVPSGKILAYLFLGTLVSDLSLVQMGAGH